jgi:hypothetical protein
MGCVMHRMAIPALAALAMSAQAAVAAPFDVYRAACLDTGVDMSRIRAASQGWSRLTDAERETLAPGNPAAVEGWAIVQGNARYLVSISSRPAGGMAGERSSSVVVSCGVLTPKADDAPALKAYSDYLRRPPSTTDRADGMATYTWSVQGGAGLSLHYLVSGGALPGLSLSVSSIRN